MGAFEGFGVLDQNPVAGCNAGAGHDCSGGRQAQGTRAGNYQYRHSVDQCCFNRRAVEPPAEQGGKGDQQHHRDKYLADLVHQLLDRRLGGLRVLYQADNARQYGLRPQGHGLDNQATFAIDGAAGDFIPRLFRHRQAFATDQGLVGMALAFNHFAIHREPLAGFDQHQIIETQITDGDILFLAVDHAQGAFGAKGFKGADGAGGLALGTAFEIFAQQHQGDHNRRGLEIQMGHAAGFGDGPFIQAQAITGAGAQGDQQVHIARAGLDGFPRGHIKTCAQNKLHRGRQYKLGPGGQHPMDAKRRKQHRQHQRQRQYDSQGQRPAFTVQAFLLIVFGGFFTLVQAGTIAGLSDRVDQQARINLAEQFDMGPLGGEVDADALDPGHLGQGFFYAPCARGAGHATDIQFQAVGGHAIACLLHSLDQCRQALGRRFDTGLFSGQVDADRTYTGHFGQGFFHTPCTAGTGHAINRQIELGGHEQSSSRSYLSIESTLTPWQGQGFLLFVVCRSIFQFGGLEVHTLFTQGDAVFAHIPGLQGELLRGRHQHAGQAAGGLPGEQLEADIDAGGRQVKGQGLLLKQSPGQLVVDVHTHFAVGRHLKAFAGNDQHSVVLIGICPQRHTGKTQKAD